MKSKTKLIKVTASAYNLSKNIKVARGIILKPRGLIEHFIENFMFERGISEYQLYVRTGFYLSTSIDLRNDVKTILYYHFEEFELSEIDFYGKDLSDEELVRDFKLLKKVFI